MLAKRTNILFENDFFHKLQQLAKEKKISIGQLIRDAVAQVYFHAESQNAIRQASAGILATRKISKKSIDYKMLINYGRKH